MAITDQNEIKKVITIDEGDSLTILKDLKTRIDSLKASLSTLDESSEEYSQTLEKINFAESKLNGMLSQNTSTLNAANKKYEELTGTLVDLEKQLKNVNNAGEKLELEDKIDGVIDNISELIDGVSNTNDGINKVGISGEEAFSKILNGINENDSKLGNLGGSLKQVISSIVKCGKTAITAGQEIATAEALATAGITLIISGIVAIIAYWDEISGFLDTCYSKLENLIGIQNKYTDSVEDSARQIEVMNQKLDDANDKLNFSLRLMRAQGATSLELAKAEVDGLQKQKNDILKQLSEGYSKGLSGEVADNLEKQLADTNKKLKKAKEDVIIEQAKVDRQNQASRAAEEKSVRTHNSNISKINSEHRSKEELEEQRLEEQRKRQSEQILERLHKANTDELTLLEEKYNKEKELLQSTGNDITLLTQEYEDKRQEIIDKSIEREYQTRTDALKTQEEELKAEKEQRLFDSQFNEYDGDNLDAKQEKLTAEFEIEQEFMLRRIELQQEFLDNFIGSAEQQEEAEKKLDALRQDLANKQKKYQNETAKNGKEKAEEERKYREKALNSSLKVASSIFGALADLAEEGSEEQKLLAIMQTTMDTLSGAIAAYKSMAEIPIVGPGLGIAAAAAVTAAGIANIAKIKQTTKNSSPSLGSNAEASAPSISKLSMTTVDPLLDAESDINRITSLQEQGDSSKEQQNIRVYVVDQDIRDANTRAEVVENNATF